MDMKQLEAFACVAEQRSFSKAARLLHLTQPTVSARVASLEQELQIQLLQRPSAIPSEAGELLYHYAGQMLALRTQALDALQPVVFQWSSYWRNPISAGNQAAVPEWKQSSSCSSWVSIPPG